MEFTFLDALSLPGDPAKPNDDAWGQTSTAAVVLDGATNLCEPLLPGDSDAAWLARFAARRLMAHAQDGRPARASLEAALGEAQRSFAGLRRRPPTRNHENPHASMMFVTAAQDGFDALWFGDCGALALPPAGPAQIVGDAFDKRAAEARRVRMLADAKGLAPAARASRPEFLSALRAARDTVNTDKGGWLFGPDPKAAEHVRSAHVAAAPGTLLLLASDGFLALACDFACHDADGLIAAARDKGLEALGIQLRAVENDDPDGRKFPRFKTSDDATAVLLRLG
ncbi:MAG: protein phosphatase 2C domain-containing protein [Alphaproteobacteria bacterium]|nr:protein phosphatase 2C domain-containing protein [Alphaproteobacteria bacterium]MBV9693702.1 protein phosphatase 2C domain-containing protein [Alphaproteobacteria bacterium]